MSQVAIPPKGIYVPVPTFFSSQPNTSANKLQPAIDIQAQTSHAIFLAKSGITGLVLLGSTGEAIHLSRTERFDLISGVRKGLDQAEFKDYPIQAGVLTNGVDETLEWLEDYAKAGAQWGLVLVPGYFGAAASQEGIVEWYRLIADQSPIPILIYNYPGVTNNVFVQPSTYTTLASHPNIVGAKLSHGNVSTHLQISSSPHIDASTFRVYSGFGQQLAPILLHGAAGVIDGLASFYPKTVVRLFKVASEFVQEGKKENLQEVRRLQWVVSTAEEFIGKFGVVGIKEGTSRVAGFGEIGSGRLPIRGKLADGDWEKWSDVFFKDIAEVEKGL